MPHILDNPEQLAHMEKMASLGSLTAGIAHELNNPINFVSANVKPLRQDVEDIINILEQYNNITPDDLENGDIEDKLADIEDLKDEIDLPYVVEEVENLLGSITSGATRVADIVKDLRNFSRLDEDDLKHVDLHEGLESTLTLLNKELGAITVKKEFGDIVPEIDCYPGHINQVWLNIMTNAIKSMDNGGELHIQTDLDENHNVRVKTTDTGCGMTEEVKTRLFEPFFTTRDVGEGTGLGMSVSYGVIEKHNGNILVDSEVDTASTLTVTLPLTQDP